MKHDAHPLYTLIELTADYVIPGRSFSLARAGAFAGWQAGIASAPPPLERDPDITLNKGLHMLAVENRDEQRTMNLYAVVENVTSSTFSLTGAAWLRCGSVCFRPLRAVFAGDLIIAPGDNTP